MQKCKRCDSYIHLSEYHETGAEFYCACQNTLQAEFDKNLWINMEDYNENSDKKANK